MTKQATIYKAIADKLITAMVNGSAPWQRPWKLSEQPVSLQTGKPYRGINTWILLLKQWDKNYTSNYWLTYKRAQALGGNVRRGEKGTRVVLWKPWQRDEDSNGETTTRRGLMLREFTVFNLDQCDGITLATRWTGKTADVEGINSADDLVARYRNGAPTIQHRGDTACYIPASDSIRMPKKAAFNSSAEYYSTLFHELAHSTGHKSRLARAEVVNTASFDSHNYSVEELTAEFTAAYCNALAGIECERATANSAAYLASWSRKLRDDPGIVVRAAQRAQKAADWIAGVEPREQGENGDSEVERAA